MFDSKFDAGSYDDTEMSESYQNGYIDGITAGTACRENQEYQKSDFMRMSGYDTEQTYCYMDGFNLGFEESENPLIAAYWGKDSEALVQAAEGISSNLGFSFSYIDKAKAKIQAENLHDIASALNEIGDNRYLSISSQIENDASLVSDAVYICDTALEIREKESDVNNIDVCYMVSEADERLLSYFDALIYKFDEPSFGKYTEMEPVFINLSNHPSIDVQHPERGWDEKQMSEAAALGRVVDYPFPNVDPKTNTEQLVQTAKQIVSDITEKYGQNVSVMCMGQLALVSALNQEFADNGIQTYVSTTERAVIKNGNETVLGPFKYVGLRESNTPRRERPDIEPREGGCVVNLTGREFAKDQAEATLAISENVVMYPDKKDTFVNAHASQADIDKQEQKIVDKLVSLDASYVVLSGEQSLHCRIAELCEENGIQALAGMSERKSQILDNGDKKAVFEFQGYCKMNNYGNESRAIEEQHKNVDDDFSEH